MKNKSEAAEICWRKYPKKVEKIVNFVRESRETGSLKKVEKMILDFMELWSQQRSL